MTELISIIALGAAVALFGVGLLRSHVRAWRKQQSDPQLDDRERNHYRLQYRRRMQSSGLIVVLGLLVILAHEWIVPWDRAPGLFAAYVCLLLGLVLWIVCLALADYASTRVHTRLALSRLDRSRRQLEASLEQLRKQHRQE